DKLVSLGPLLEKGIIGPHGVAVPVEEEYDHIKKINGTHFDETIKNGLPMMRTAKKAINAVLHLSSATNGKVSQKAWETAEGITGRELKDISADRAAEKITFENITVQPREVIPTAVFSGSNKAGRRCSPFTTNIKRFVPLRTLTGRQHFYIDHEIFLQYG